MTSAPLLFVRAGGSPGVIELCVSPGLGAHHIFVLPLARAASLGADLAAFVALGLGRGHVLPEANKTQAKPEVSDPHWVGWDLASETGKALPPGGPSPSPQRAMEKLAEAPGTRAPRDHSNASAVGISIEEGRAVLVKGSVIRTPGQVPLVVR